MSLMIFVLEVCHQHPHIECSTSHSKVEAKSSTKRAKSTKTFVNNKHKKTSKETHAGRKAGHPASEFTEVVGTSTDHG